MAKVGHVQSSSQKKASGVSINFRSAMLRLTSQSSSYQSDRVV
jgi:hypothetical protein